jgi:hypothetical protein
MQCAAVIRTSPLALSTTLAVHVCTELSGRNSGPTVDIPRKEWATGIPGGSAVLDDELAAAGPAVSSRANTAINTKAVPSRSRTSRP